ncbi:MAG: hypothetical protein ACRD4B_01435 [Acidobacteriota bacterium]
MTDTDRQVAIFLIAVLEAVLHEQVKAKLISHDAARYVIAAVRDQTYKQDWIN